MLTSISKIHITTIMKVILSRFTLYKKEVTIFQQIFKVSLSVNGLEKIKRISPHNRRCKKNCPHFLSRTFLLQ